MPGQPLKGEEQCICGRQVRVPTQVLCFGRGNGPKEHGASFLYDSAFFIAYLYNGFTVNLVGDRIATRLCRLLEIRISILLPFRSL